MTIRKGSIGSAVKAWQEFLITLNYQITADGIFGERTRIATVDFQTLNELDVDGIVGPNTISKAVPLGYSEPVITLSDGVTSEQLSYIMKTAKQSKIELHLSLANTCMSMFQINTPLRMQHFLAQCGHESCSLLYMHEIASGAEYEGRHDLGNTEPGDGKRFRGRGPIQLTGRSNYTSFFNYLNRPELIHTPEILETDLALAWQASGWYWTVLRNINKWADKDNAEMVTRFVNGGLTGYADRLTYLHRAKEIIK